MYADEPVYISEFFVISDVTALRCALIALASSVVCALTGLTLLLAQDGYAAILGTREGVRAVVCGAGLVGVVLSVHEAAWWGVCAVRKVSAGRVSREGASMEDVEEMVIQSSAAEVEWRSEDPTSRWNVVRRRGTGDSNTAACVYDAAGWETEPDASKGLSHRKACKTGTRRSFTWADGASAEHRAWATLASVFAGCFAPAVGVAVLGRTERVDMMHAFTLCMTGAWMIVGKIGNYTSVELPTHKRMCDTDARRPPPESSTRFSRTMEDAEKIGMHRPRANGVLMESERGWYKAEAGCSSIWKLRVQHTPPDPHSSHLISMSLALPSTHRDEQSLLKSPDSPRSCTSVLSGCTLVFPKDIERTAGSGSDEPYNARIEHDFSFNHCASELIVNLVSLTLWTVVASTIASLFFALAGIVATLGAPPYSAMFSTGGLGTVVVGAAATGCAASLGTVLYHALSSCASEDGLDWRLRNQLHISAMSGTATLAAALGAIVAPAAGVFLLGIPGLTPLDGLALSCAGLAALVCAGSGAYVVALLAQKVGVMVPMQEATMESCGAASHGIDTPYGRFRSIAPLQSTITRTSSMSTLYHDAQSYQSADDHHLSEPASDSRSQPISAPRSSADIPAPLTKAHLMSSHSDSDRMPPNVNVIHLRDGALPPQAYGYRPNSDPKPSSRGGLRRTLGQLITYANKHRTFRLALWSLFSTLTPCAVAALLTLIGGHVADSASVYKDVPVGPMCASAALGGFVLGLPCMLLAWLRIGLVPCLPRAPWDDPRESAAGRWMRYVVLAAVAVACVFGLPLATQRHLRGPAGFGGHDGILIMAAALGCLRMIVPVLGLIGVVGIAVKLPFLVFPPNCHVAVSMDAHMSIGDVRNAPVEEDESRTAPVQTCRTSSRTDPPAVASDPYAYTSHQSQVDAWNSPPRVASALAHRTPSPAQASLAAPAARAAIFVAVHLLLSIALTFVLGGLSQFLLGLYLLQNRPPYASLTVRAAMPATVVGSVLIGSLSALAWTAVAHKLHLPFAVGRLPMRRYVLPVLSTSAGSFFVGVVGYAVVQPRGAAESGFRVVHALAASAVGLVACTAVVVFSCVMSLVWFV
ncbi:hypothetical protein C8Q80DRAFT_1343484 [Daedaleopsis nitida]|nr:hypothetical protein C8Q80DRAFT_1343484 [Daedaleopsis nitida]